MRPRSTGPSRATNGIHTSLFYNGAKRVGYTKCSTGHMAINSAFHDGRAGCKQLDCFQGCKSGAKGRRLALAIRQADYRERHEARYGVMCKIYATTDAIPYESRTRSLRIHGVLTAIRRENLFWDVLTEMATREQLTTNGLIATLHDELHDGLPEERDEVTNFASSCASVVCDIFSQLASREIVTQAPGQAASHAVG